MNSMIFMFILKLVTLAGSTATTLWLISFFAFESLAAYRWELLLGGIALVALGEGGSYLLARRWMRRGV